MHRFHSFSLIPIHTPPTSPRNLSDLHRLHLHPLLRIATRQPLHRPRQALPQRRQRRRTQRRLPREARELPGRRRQEPLQRSQSAKGEEVQIPGIHGVMAEEAYTYVIWCHMHMYNYIIICVCMRMYVYVYVYVSLSLSHSLSLSISLSLSPSIALSKSSAKLRASEKTTAPPGWMCVCVRRDSTLLNDQEMDQKEYDAIQYRVFGVHIYI